MKKITTIILSVLALTSLNSCEFLFGSRQDDTVDDVLNQGKIDPSLIPATVGYVPVLPFWSNVSNPIDIYVGYDEMVYVIDDVGLNVFDLTGTKKRTIAIPGATKVVQDRRLHTYVIGRVNREINGEVFNLAAVYQMSGAGTAAGPVFVDTLIHPFNDRSRNNTNFRGANDVAVEFMGIGTLADNTVYLARKGPINSITSTFVPDNAVLTYDVLGNNLGFASGLNPISSSLKSVLDISGLTTFAAPPQNLFGIANSGDFLMLQSAENAEYKALWIRQINNPETGIEFVENPLLNFDTTRATRFLYESFRFSNPTDICIAPDETQYIFIVDAGKDSLFQFTSQGFEGVQPPANSGLTKQVIASFGGRGAGPFQFNQPTGVAYYNRVVFVADKGNNRIMRFKLSTDLER